VSLGGLEPPTSPLSVLCVILLNASVVRFDVKLNPLTVGLGIVFKF